MTQPKRSLHWSILLLVLAALAFGAVGSAFANTPAGTEIRNQASAKYVANGENREAVSNVVLVMVRQIAGVDVKPDANPNGDPVQEINVVRGQTVTVQFEVTNTGNGPDSFLVTPHLQGDSITPGTYELYIDQNGNGLVDAGDPRVTTYDPNPEFEGGVLGPVPAGSTVNLLARLRVSDVASKDDTFTIYLTAASEFSKDGETPGTDTSGTIHFKVVEDGVVSGTLHAASNNPDDKSKVSGQGDGTITYTVTLINQGINAADNIVVTLPVPGGTTPGDDYPEGGEVTIPKLNRGQAFELTYTVKVNSGLPGGSTIENDVSFTVNNGPVIKTNRVITTVLYYSEIELSRTQDDGQYEISPANAGATYSFEYKVTNESNTADTIYVKATLNAPWPVELYAADGTTPLAKAGEHSILGVLNQNGEATFVVKVRVPAGEKTSDADYQLSLEAWPALDPGEKKSESATFTGVNGPDMVLELTSSPGPVNPGQVAQYEVEVTNLGPAQDLFHLKAGNVPEGYTVEFFNEAGNRIGDVIVPGVNPDNPGANTTVVVVRVTVPADAEPLDTNIIVTATSQNDSGLHKNVDLPLKVNEIVSVTIESSQAGSVNSGGYTTYTLTVTNQGNTVQDVEVTTEVAGSGDQKLRYRFIEEGTQQLKESLELKDLEGGASRQITVRVEAPTEVAVGTTEMVNVVVSNTSGKLDSASLTTTVTGGELQLIKSVPSGTNPGPKDPIEYTVVATNISVIELTNVVIYEKVPTHTTFESASPHSEATLWYSTDGGSTWESHQPAKEDVTDVKWDFTGNPLAPNASFEVTFTVTVK